MPLSGNAITELTNPVDYLELLLEPGIMRSGLTRFYQSKRHHSYLNATIGSTLVARPAGR